MEDIFTIEEIRFLKQLAHKLKTQDRRGTSKPVIYQILDINVRWDNDDSEGFDEVKVFDNDGNILDTLEDMKKYIIDNPEEFEIDLEDLSKETIENYDIDEIIEIYKEAKFDVSYGHCEQELKNAFLTKKSAEQHLEENGHHYHEKAHIYVSYAWRNAELEKLLDILEKFDKED